MAMSDQRAAEISNGQGKVGNRLLKVMLPSSW